MGEQTPHQLSDEQLFDWRVFFSFWMKASLVCLGVSFVITIGAETERTVMHRGQPLVLVESTNYGPTIAASIAFILALISIKDAFDPFLEGYKYKRLGVIALTAFLAAARALYGLTLF